MKVKFGELENSLGICHIQSSSKANRCDLAGQQLEENPCNLPLFDLSGFQLRLFPGKTQPNALGARSPLT